MKTSFNIEIITLRAVYSELTFCILIYYVYLKHKTLWHIDAPKNPPELFWAPCQRTLRDQQKKKKDFGSFGCIFADLILQ